MQKGNRKNNLKINPFPKMEEEVLDFWDKGKIFEKSLLRPGFGGQAAKSTPDPSREGNIKDYVFYDGPPFATGMPHYGHIVASLMKDAVPRYWTMKGYRVERRWGWDCHGLPIENLAEQELKLKDKTDIEKIGIEKFNKYCESIVLRYADDWKKIIRRIGRWVDMKNDYKTMDADYMESIWWVFKSLWDKDLIYQGHKAMHICPRCGTTLSNFEVTQNYKDIKDISCTVKFEIVSPTNLQIPYKFTNKDRVYILAWTTTPWTLIGNVALAINKNETYIAIKFNKINSNSSKLNIKEGETYILLESAVGKIFKDATLGSQEMGGLTESAIFGSINNFQAEVSVLRGILGNNLVGLKYKPLFDYYAKRGLASSVEAEPLQNGWKIYGADFVNIEEGTGVVHIAPAFGEDDMDMGKKYNLPFVQHVDESGRFKKEVKDFAGMEVKPSFAKATDGKPKDNHMKTDIEIIKYLARKNLLFAKEKYEHSYPHCWRCETPLLNYAAESWFVKVTKIKDDLIKNNKDITWVPAHIKDGRFGKWLEQARDWAISRSRYWGAPLPVWVCDKCGEKAVVGSRKELETHSHAPVQDLHKQFVDKIIWKCNKCDGTMRRISEVLDCWFESGSMPYAQEHYPFENKEKFEKNFPADFIAEGVDQTRGWFYTLHVLANALKINNKSSAAFKNVIVNGIVLAEDGQKMSKRLNNYPDPAKLFEKYSVDAMRYYLLSSSVLLAENLNFSEDGVKEALRKVEMILWNVYKFYELFANSRQTTPNNAKIIESKNILDKWIIARLNQLINEVTENMDNYNLPKAVRPIEEFISDLSTWYLRRSRDRFKSNDQKEKKAALQTTAYVLIELSKIMAPFMPFIAEQIWQRVTGNDFKDEDKSVHLEKWPSYIKTKDEDIKKLHDKKNLNKKEQKQLNTFVDDYQVLEKMGTLKRLVEEGLSMRDEAGIKVRQPLQAIFIANFDNLKLSDTYNDFEQYKQLLIDELNVKEIISTENNGGMCEAIKLDTKITHELKQEGIKRELVRFINNLRKNAGMTIQDRAVVYWECANKEIKQAIKKYKDEIMKDVLASEMDEEKNKKIDLSKDVKVNGVEVWLGIKLSTDL